MATPHYLPLLAALSLSLTVISANRHLYRHDQNLLNALEDYENVEILQQYLLHPVQQARSNNKALMHRALTPTRRDHTRFSFKMFIPTSILLPLQSLLRRMESNVLGNFTMRGTVKSMFSPNYREVSYCCSNIRNTAQSPAQKHVKRIEHRTKRSSVPKVQIGSNFVEKIEKGLTKCYYHGSIEDDGDNSNNNTTIAKATKRKNDNIDNKIHQERGKSSVDAAAASAVFSTCHGGLLAYFSINGERHNIHYLREEKRHIIYNVKNHKSEDGPYTCGHKQAGDKAHDHDHSKHNHTSPHGKSCIKSHIYRVYKPSVGRERMARENTEDRQEPFFGFGTIYDDYMR
eukprot:jgi/Bigna1/83647/fgenesh1_pg.112_\